MKKIDSASVVLICPHYIPDKGGLAGHTAVLGTEIAALGVRTTVVTRPGPVADTFPGAHISPTIAHWSLRGMPALYRQTVAAQPDVVLIQYVPYMYWRRGPGVSVSLFALWLAFKGYRVVAIVHEAYIPWSKRPRLLAVGLVQRLALCVLIVSCTRVATSTSSLTRMLRRWLPFAQSKMHTVPVFSNIPLIEMSEPERSARRKRLSIEPDDVALVYFGSQHEGKLFGMVLRAFRMLYTRGYPVVLLVIGQQKDAVLERVKDWNGSIGQHVVATGYCSDNDVSFYLRCGDIFLSPFLDGVSTRRGSVMAALQHGLPVVTTVGPATDRALFADAVAMTAIGDEEGYVRAVEDLLRDPLTRWALGKRGHDLSERAFSWPLISKQLLQLGGLDRDEEPITTVAPVTPRSPDKELSRQ